MKKIAIIRLSALGDVIVSAAMASCIKKFYPRCALHWMIDSAFAQILTPSNMIDQIHSIPLKQMLKNRDFKGLFSVISSLRREEYDCVIDMQGLLKSALLGKMLKTKRFVGFHRTCAREGAAGYFYDHGVRIAYEENIMLRNARVVYEALNLEMSFEEFFQQALNHRDSMFDYDLQADVAGILKDFKKNHDNRKIVLFILEASIPSKTYATGHFIELGRRLEASGVCIALLWHQDEGRAKEIAKGLSHPLILPKLNLMEVKALIKNVDLIIGGDTGITHLAWAMKNASITLYGNTSMKRLKLQGEKNLALSGSREASYDKRDFSINNITPQVVYEALEGIL